MTKADTLIAVAVVALIATHNVNATFVRRLTDEDSGSLDFDSSEGSNDDSASSLEDFLNSQAGDTVPKFGQCGGIGFIGNSQCAHGYVCVLSNPWYAQCLPKGSQTSVQTKKHSHRSKVHTEDADLLVDDLTTAEVIPAWEQCGGKGVDFDFTTDDSKDEETPKKPCEEGYSCAVINEWYYQCKPLEKPSGVHLWDQCGGEDYTGPADCTAGSVCKYFNAWYSQCVPKEQEFS
ncbi:Fungal cellulose binding domain [Phytophthora infestans]|uniref:Fungal cellulose binding domain n=1 Tax=Phytophthora infestans TaxID=4787 RepID=A0A833TH24_PHYIN|nr:Fungal cellulose binding domain [Phytophthora infestans]KAF4130464.1 Fungal cellulose binding domain [Phytophthora infestans]